MLVDGIGMADNKLSRVARIEDGFFDENDPLAELARIVGQSTPVEKSHAAVVNRREPEFDLEEEETIAKIKNEYNIEPNKYLIFAEIFKQIEEASA